MEGEDQVVHVMAGGEGGDGIIKNVVVEIPLNNDLISSVQPSPEVRFKILKEGSPRVAVVIGVVHVFLVLFKNGEVAIEDGAISPSVGLAGTVGGYNPEGEVGSTAEPGPAPAA